MSSKIFLHKVSNFIQRHQLLNKGDKHLVALSGGADSVSLLRVLLSLDYHIEAVHCNFNLRGQESDCDEQFCQNLCDTLNVKLYTVHFDTSKHAEEKKISIEMAARELRYTYFEQLRQEINAKTICVAHHRDDSVETLIINLLRGTGIHGLRGISPRKQNVVRPLLGVNRQEIETFLHELSQPFVTDSSNLVDQFIRNKVRLNVIPLLQSINPSICECLDKTASHLREVAHIYDEVIEKKADNAILTMHPHITIDRQRIENESILFCLLKKYNFTSSQTEQIYTRKDMASGKRFLSSTHELLINRDKLLIRPLSTTHSLPQTITSTGKFDYDSARQFHIEVIPVDTSFVISKSSHCVCLDAKKVSFPLTIRRIKNGDRFIPFGMKGSKLVSDYLTDRKKNLFEKEEQLVVVDKNDAIIWLVNERIDAKFILTKESDTALRISFFITESAKTL